MVAGRHRLHLGGLGGCGAARAQRDGDSGGDGRLATDCHAVGCGPIWQFRRALPVALALGEIQQLRVEVCRNDWCFGRSLADFVPSEPFMMNGGLGTRLPRTTDADPVIDVIFWGTDGEKAGEVQVTWRLGRLDGAAGDVFSFDLEHTDGTSILRVEETVDYEMHYPNGIQCAPGCQSATSRGSAAKTNAAL